MLLRPRRRLLHDDMKDSGLLPLLGRCVRSFQRRRQTRKEALDLAEAVHITLRTLDALDAREQGRFFVTRRARGRAADDVSGSSCCLSILDPHALHPDNLTPVMGACAPLPDALPPL